MRVDPYKDVVLHNELFDWSDPTLTADSITRRLIGPVPYWKQPEFAGKKPHEIERQILFDGGRAKWHLKSPYGKPYYQHMLVLLKLLFKETDITPSLADVTMFTMIALGTEDIKIVNAIGSTNSGKSAGGARLMFGFMYVDPEYTAGFVANPFDNAADSTIWGDIEDLWDQLCNNHPNDTGTGYREASALFPWGKKYAGKYLEFIPGIPKAATIELRNTKKVGKFKGTKSRHATRGVLMVDIDEVNEVESQAFLKTLSNIASQPGFICYTSQNFKDPEDMGGRLTEPRPRFGGPSSFEELDIDLHQYWHSAASSITIRFDGHRSPNILSGRTIYPRLFHIKDKQRLENDYGLHSPEYASQARSFPVRGDETNSVLNRAKISASRHLDEFYTILTVHARVAFCDPAFGGRDKAIIGWALFCDAMVTDGEGKQSLQQLLVFKDHFSSIQLVKDAKYNDHWFDKMKAVDIPLNDFIEGSDVSYEDQIAIYAKEYCKTHQVPANNFGFDFSMRPDIVSSMNRMLGFSVHAFDYNQPPEGAFLQNIKKETVDACKNRCSELAFLAADYFLTKQIRGGARIPTAIEQLSRSNYETKAGKHLIEDKKTYKARWGASPDHRDVLMGITGMAHRRGFRQIAVTSGQESSSLWSQINAGNAGKSRVVKALPR